MSDESWGRSSPAHANGGLEYGTGNELGLSGLMFFGELL